MIVFNHLFASHLVDWSKRLRDIGVLTGLLTNEGMMRSQEARLFQSGRHHREGHVDLFFCWNEAHRQAIEQEGVYKDARVETIGVPRFDFYFEPWANIVRRHDPEPRTRPRILFCTNTGLVKFKDLPREHGDRHFAAWAGYQKNYGDPWARVEAQGNARKKFVEHAAALAASGKYEIVFRPHPAEREDFYRSWLTTLPAEHRANVCIDGRSNITSLILDCDLQISEEGCTTGVESWIAGKPTIGLTMYHNSPLNFEERAQCHVRCENSTLLSALVDAQLANPEQDEFRELRRQHLVKWCGSPDGRSCERIASAIAEMLRARRVSDWAMINANDYRRAAKLFGYKRLGLPYHFDPLLFLKRRVLGNRYAMKQLAYEKSIKPADVVASRRRIDEALKTLIRSQ
jgi:surface carbohydrate biosynthesis protein